jgi:hypothetical protein
MRARAALPTSPPFRNPPADAVGIRMVSPRSVGFAYGNRCARRHRAERRLDPPPSIVMIEPVV